VDFQRLLEKYALGEMLVDDLPCVADTAIESGYEAEALYELAGARGRDPEELRCMLQRALDELDIKMPTPAQAALSNARSIAAAILAGDVSPYEGARQIWADVYTRFPELKQLRVFVGCASEYEDNETHRDEYSRRIVEESTNVLDDA